MNLSAYLDRINYRGARTPTSEPLRALHLAHVLAVPFENLDNFHGRAVSLEPADLFAKIVVAQRGGYCFELNGLFSLLLEALGFSVTRLVARVGMGRSRHIPEAIRRVVVGRCGVRWERIA